MADFSFITLWKIEAPLDPVWDALLRVEDWPNWWRGVVKVEVLCRGDANRIGFRSRQVWKSRLPYQLQFEGAVTGMTPKSRIEITADGELRGTGLMRFAGDGCWTIFQYDWNVSTTKPWMNVVAPVARPFFSWNHDVVMNWGAEGLAKLLGGAKVETSHNSVL